MHPNAIIMTGLQLLQRTCHDDAVKGGWYTDPETGEPRVRNEPEMLCLIHSEISEALEGIRKDLKDDHLPERDMVEVEMADAVIRIFDYAGYKGMDLAGAILDKMEYNRKRADHKIENRAKTGGKKF